MKIKDGIYSALSPQQRIAASISAMARKDNDELQRLRETCPKHRYLATDDAYAGPLANLIGLSIAIECDLRGLALDYVVACRVGAEEEHREHLLKSFASIREASRRMVQHMGIDFDDFLAATVPAHHTVEVLTGHTEGKATAELVEHYLTVLGGKSTCSLPA